MLPPGAVVALTRDATLLSLLKEAESEISEIGFPLGHLADHLSRCTILFSQNEIEICPAFLPSKRLSYLADPEIRRIYLSATLTSEVDFCRAFGRRPSNKIEPESDAGMGERLIVLAERNTLTNGGTANVSAVVAPQIKIVEKRAAWRPRRTENEEETRRNAQH